MYIAEGAYFKKGVQRVTCKTLLDELNVNYTFCSLF